MIVQARLADGDNLFVPRRLFQFTQGLVGDHPGIVRVDRDCRVQILKPLGELHCLPVMLRIGSHRNPADYAGLPAASDNRISVTRQILKSQMTMCINQLRLLLLKCKIMETLQDYDEIVKRTNAGVYQSVQLLTACVQSTMMFSTFSPARTVIT